MIEVIKGDITKLDVDIIVNAANKSLLGGGGVDGAIHRAAGSGLLEECRRLNGCNTGEAKITNGYNLKARKVIHTVGPVYSKSNKDVNVLLKNCYWNSMILAEEYRKMNNLDMVSIAFPCISTGVYRFPHKEAAHIAIDTIREIDNPNIKVIFVCFLDEDYDLYNEYLREK